MTTSLTPPGPDAQHMLDPSSTSVAIVLGQRRLPEAETEGGDLGARETGSALPAMEHASSERSCDEQLA